MTSALKYKGVLVDHMSPRQINAAVIELLTAMSPKKLCLAVAEIERIKAERPVENREKGEAS